MLHRVISGGQTGADQGGVFAARMKGIETGGTAPLGWLTEEGPAPWLAEYGLVECSEAGYPARTRANARDSDATIWFGDTVRDSAGFKCTMNAARSFAKPVLIVEAGKTTPRGVIDWIRANNVSTLNVAGNRESRNPGLSARVQRFLHAVFDREQESPYADRSSS